MLIGSEFCQCAGYTRFPYLHCYALDFCCFLGCILAFWSIRFSFFLQVSF